MSEQEAPAVTASGETPAIRRRWSGWRMLFLVSLAINLLIAGATLHRVWAWRHGPPDPLAGPIMRMLHDLPADRREALMPKVDAVRQSLKALRRNAGEARQEAASVLQREPFDRTNFVQALERMMAAENNGRQAAIPALASLAEAMSGAERQAFSKQILTMRWRGGPQRD